MTKRPFLLIALALIFAGQAGAFPGWLDSPTRDNAHDPRSPLYKAAAAPPSTDKGFIRTAATSSCSAPAWSPNAVAYAVGALVSYANQIYRCDIAHLSEVGWDPISAPALWVLVGPCQSSPVATPVTPSLTPTAVPVSHAVWRVNAAGPAYTDSQGNAWSADENFNGGTAATASTAGVSGALPGPADQVLYQTQRYGSSFSYSFAVPAGSYQVTLKFAETYFTSAGARQFNASINGAAELTNFDIFAAAGGSNIAVDKVYNNIAPSSGTITIAFGPAAINYAEIQAIQIIPQPSQPTTPTSTITATPTQSSTSTPTQIVTQTATATATPTLTPSFTVTLTQVVTQTSTATATATTSQTPTLTVSATSTPTPTATSVPVGQSVWRVNAAGPAYTDSLGHLWSADEDFSGGTAAAASTAAVSGALPGASDQALYQTQRYGTSFSYAFAVPAGSYQVTLKFAETYFTAAGARQFNVAINGTPELTNFDIFAAAGGANIALDKVYNNIAPSNGSISIAFGPAAINNAEIQAIQIIPQPAATFTPTVTATSTQTLSSTQTQTPTRTPTASQTSARLVGYLPDYDGSYATFAHSLNFNKMTHLDLAFVNPPTCSGKCTASSSMSFSLDQSDADIATLVNAAHAAGVKVIASIGGGGGDAQIIQFYNAGLSSQLVASLNTYVAQHNLDGVDLDIEDPNNMGANYATFASALISTFRPEGKLVTAAVAEYLQSAMPTATLLQFDFVNVMNYSDLADAQTSTSYFASLGEPKNKIVLGVPFFGQSDDGNTEEDYSTILAAYPGAGSANSVSGGSLDGGLTLNYVGNAEMAQETQLGVQYGGIMIWELSQDAPAPNSLLTIIQNNMPQANQTPTATPSSTPVVVQSIWRVNAAGGAYTDSQGNAWAADENFNGGTAAAASTAAVSGALPGAADQALYQTQRYGTSFSYSFAVPAGSYQVRLKFAETYFTAAGAREFNVAINGTSELTNFDIFAAAGGANIALDKVYDNITPSSGMITVAFGPAAINNAEIQAIQIIPEPSGTQTPTPTVAATSACPAPAPNFGPNVLIFDPSMSSASIQSQIDSIYSQQAGNQFGTARYALLFKPGTYNNSISVGYYTQALGLGATPDSVLINGGVTSNAALANGNATCNFWQGAENMAVAPSGGTDKWAVSQACPLRRMHIKGGIVLSDTGSTNWSSGGFLGDSLIDGQIDSGTQQQWLSRNSQWGTWTGSNWNMVFVGDVNAPSSASWPNPPNTVISQSPASREKPFLQIDSCGNYSVFVPALATNSQGTTWSGGSEAGQAIPLSQFYIARSSVDTAASMNAALAQGLNLLLTPGVYSLTAPLSINNPNTVVLGLGIATLLAQNGTAAMTVADVDGVKIAGILFDAGATSSPILLQVGGVGASASHAANPTSLSDLFFRVGGAAVGKAALCLQINSNDVIGDDFWIWRADHSNGVGWTVNTADNGLVVNGNDVTIYGLAVEHFQKFQTQWNGNGGKVYFYQSEEPYDVPDQASWMDGSENGYPSYKVADTVTSHQAYGVGVYCYFSTNPAVALSNAIEVPSAGLDGAMFHNMTTISLGGVGTISSILNGWGSAVNSGTQRSTLAQ